MTANAKTAKSYFEAFHEGRLDEVLSYFSSAGVVRFGTESEKSAKEFFPETKDLISQVEFETHGIYTSGETTNVLIHFSFTMPSETGEPKTTEAIDIIEFDNSGKIKRVKVIAKG